MLKPPGALLLSLSLGLALVLSACVKEAPTSSPLPADSSDTSIAREIAPVPPYKPRGPVDNQSRVLIDLRDMDALMATSPVDWVAVRAIYTSGRNASPLSLKQLATSTSLLGQFGEWKAAFGGVSFLDGHIEDALAGNGRANGLSDEARRSIIEQGVLAIVYGKVLEELDNASSSAGDRDAAAADYVDEAWAFYAGAAEAPIPASYSLSAFAVDASPLIDPSIQVLFEDLQGSAGKGDVRGFDKNVTAVRGQLNAIFLRHLEDTLAKAAAENGQPEVLAAEAWASWQVLRPAVYAASAGTAGSIEQYLSEKTLRSGAISSISRLLNDEALLGALMLPPEQYPD